MFADGCEMSESTVETVPVMLAERAYSIDIGTGCLATISDRIVAVGNPVHVVVITDTNVAAHYQSPVESALSAAGIRVSSIVVAPGESSKSVDQLNRLWNALLEEGTDRSSLVLALGGGVVGDLAGFVAASFARGLSFFQVPTTLLAQVDSSVGGKTGINLPGAKNMVGAFWQPRGVLIDTGDGTIVLEGLSLSDLGAADFVFI